MEESTTENHDSLLDRDATDIHWLKTKKPLNLSWQAPTRIHQSRDFNLNTEDPKTNFATCLTPNMMPNLESHSRGDWTGDILETLVSQNSSENDICVEEVLELLEGLLSNASKPSLDHIDHFSPNSNMQLDPALFTTGFPSPSYQCGILEDTNTHQYEAPLTPPESPNPSLLTIDIHSLLPNPCKPPNSSDRVCQSGIQTLLNHAEELLTRLQTSYVKCNSALNEMTLSRDHIVENFQQSEARAQRLSSQLETLAHTNTVNQQRIAELENVLQDYQTSSSISHPFKFSHQLEPEKKENPSCDVRSHSQSENLPLSRYTPSNQSYPHLDRFQHINEKCGENEIDAKTPTQSHPRSNVSNISIPDLRVISSPPNSPSPSIAKFPKLSTFRQPASPTALSPFSWNFLNMFHCQRYKNTHASLPVGNCCTSCLGKDSKCAWDTVGILKDENKYLKKRIIDLEETIDGVLDMLRRM